MVKICKRSTVKFRMFRFGGFGEVQAFYGTYISVCSRLFQEVGVHSVALIGLTFDCGFQIIALWRPDQPAFGLAGVGSAAGLAWPFDGRALPTALVPGGAGLGVRVLRAHALLLLRRL